MRQASISRIRQFSLAIAVAGLAFAAATSGWAKDQVRVAGLTWPGYGWWYIAKAKNLAPDLDITYQAIEDPFQSFALMSSELARLFVALEGALQFSRAEAA